MTGFATVVSRIREDLNRGSDYDDRIKRAILAAVQFYRAKKLAFNEFRVASGMNTGEEFGSYGPAYMQVLSIRMGDGSGGYYPLRKTDWEEIEERSTSINQRGMPVAYALQNRSIRFYPIPDKTYSYESTFIGDLWSTYRLPTDISDSVSGGWLTEAEELIRLHSMVEILQVYRQSQEDDQKAAVLQGREMVVYGMLKARSSVEQASDRIRPFM